MTWTKLSDDFSDDCWTLSDAAYRLHADALVWSNRKLLDCRIAKADMHRFKTPEAVAELLAEGYWTDEGDAYRIVHHADYQPSKEQVLARQDVNRRNGRRGGRPPKPSGTDSVSGSVSHSQSDSVSADASESAAETHSVSESKTQGDGTGQDGQLEVEHSETKAESISSTNDATCVVCEQPMLIVEDGQRTHPTCEYAGGSVDWNSLERVS